VFTLYSTTASRTLLDVSGGLLWSNYTRAGFTDTRGAVFSDAKTDEFSGKAEVKLAYQVQQGADMFTPYVKGGVKQRFDYSNSFSVLSDPTFTFDPQTFALTSDNTFWRAGGGLGFSFKNGDITGVIDGTYQGSGDSREVVGKAQLIFKLN
jgi:outer membrane autotransporter protein